MADRLLYGKQRICYTEVTDFTDFQGIGKDPMYKRFESVYSVVNKNIPEAFKDFLAHPLYAADEDQIQWYVKKWEETPIKYTDLHEEAKAKYKSIKEQTLKVYTEAIATLKGEDRQILSCAMKYIDDEFIFCYDDKVTAVAWGMKADEKKRIKGAVMHDFPIQNKRKIRFDAGEHGSFKSKLDGILNRDDGAVISHLDIPAVIPNPGYEFKCWDTDPLGMKITKDVVFHAIYNELPPDIPQASEKVRVEFYSDQRGTLTGETVHFIEKGTILPLSMIPFVFPKDGFYFEGWDRATNIPIDHDIVINAKFSEKSINCGFVAGNYGSIVGKSSFAFPYGTSIPRSCIPSVTPNKGYRFVGWDAAPENFILKEDTIFTAKYEELVPWYKRFWGWLTGRGCLKWILWLLLVMLILLLLSQLFRGCDNEGFFGGDRDKVKPIEKIDTPDGRTIDDNGSIETIIGDDGRLPDDNVIAPIIGDDGETPPLVENPGAPDIVGDRLNIYFEDDNVDLNLFAGDMNAAFPSGECEIVGVDHNVPMIQIKVPPEMRDQIRETLPSKLPDFKFFVVDESIFTIVGHISEDNEDPGWHLRAINLKEGWKYTKGSKNVIVAIVDDGIDASHEILRGRFYKPYNVFTQDNRLSTGEGHGTHVAGLAVGSDKHFNDGVSGVAPKCLLMPVQVFDNGVCTFSSVTSGIMYAIHQGASVVNVSIGPNFTGLDILPVIEQDMIARTQFKNEEKVWRRIIQVANKKNVIIVFAAGNDKILACVPPENRTNSTLNVAAIGRNFKETDFTNFGKGSNISAPGKGILSSVPANQYKPFDGTSMAAPIVSGTVALMKSLKPEISIDEVLGILQSSGRSISKNVSPMVQVDRALERLMNGERPSDSVSDAPVSEAPSDQGQSNPAPGTDVSDPPENTDDGFSSTKPGPTPETGSPGNNEGHRVDSPGSDGAVQPDDIGTDYEAIRKMIEAYKQKINELEKLLPENRK